MMDPGSESETQIQTQSQSQAGPHHSYRCIYPDCSKTYTRASHLARHRQSHQEVKPHQCDICGKSFTRQDVLSRHKKRQHLDDGGSEEGVGTPSKTQKEEEEDITDMTEDEVPEVVSSSSLWPYTQTTGESSETTLQNNINNLVMSAQAVIAPEIQQQTQINGFNGTFSNHSYPPMPALPTPASTFSWHSNNFDLDNLFFGAPTFHDVPAAPTIMNDDFSSLFATWPASNQPLQGMEMQLPPQNAPAASALAMPESSNDDFLRWLSGDMGSSSEAQPFAVPTPAPTSNNINHFETHRMPDVHASLAGHFATPSDELNGPSPRNRRPSPSHPSLQHGIHTRPPSPTLPPQQSHGDQQWPMAWDPNLLDHDAGLSTNVLEFGEVQEVEDGAADVSLHSMDETCRLAMLELLHFAQIPSNAYHRLYVRLSRLPLSILNNFLTVYFTEIHIYVPFIHKATFDPRKCSGFLLGIMIALGAQLSKLSGARSFSYFLGDLVHAAFGKVVEAERVLLREVKMLQTLLLWTFLRYNGLRRLMEMAEVFRGAYAVPLGRMHIFDDKIGLPKEVNDPSQSLERRWQIWRTWETRRRTGFASLLSEAEFTTLLNRPPVIMPREMQCRLPCSDETWNASTAHDWASLYYGKEASLQCNYAACDVVDCRPSVLRELAKQARTSAFSTSILIQMLHINVWTIRQCGSSSSPTVRTLLQEIQRSLTIVACSDNEFMPYQDNRSSAWRGVAILYHYAQMASRMAIPTLLALAGKESPREAVEAQTALRDWLINNAVSGREAALHAGQCWKLIRQGNLRAPYAAFCLLYSALVLYTCAACPQFSQPKAESDVSPSMSFRGNDDDFIVLDCEKPGVIELNYVQTGIQAVRLGEIPFSSAVAGEAILESAQTFMEQHDSWGLTFGLSRILQKVQERAKAESSAG